MLLIEKEMVQAWECGAFRKNKALSLSLPPFNAPSIPPPFFTLLFLCLFFSPSFFRAKGRVIHTGIMDERGGQEVGGEEERQRKGGREEGRKEGRREGEREREKRLRRGRRKGGREGGMDLVF